LSSAVLGVSFLLSGIGNMIGTVDGTGLRVTSAWPGWVSPIGWGQQVRPFGGSYGWLLLLPVALCVVLLAVAVLLLQRRDIARGLWPERRGNAVASRTLLSPAGLAWRLQRGVFVGWAIALGGFGLIFGDLTRQILDLGPGGAKWYQQMGGTGQVVDAFRTSIIQMAGMFVAIYVVQVLLRMRVDEGGGTLESTLATHVTRLRWMLAQILNAAAGAVLLMVLFATCMALTAGQVLHNTGTQLRELVLAGLVQVPGALVLAGVVVLAVALLPRWATAVSWVLFIAAFVIGPMFGPGLGLPRWVQDLSPFTHLPKAPALDVTAPPLLALLGVGILLAVCAALALRRRDLVLPA
jgi:ABC-2 type transport system permease protein